MTTDASTSRTLRLWPGVGIALLLVAVAYVLPLAMPDLASLGMIAAVVGALLIVIWWLAFSRARWYERVGAVAIIAAAAFAQRYVVHPSIAGGAMGMMSYLFALPTLCVALVAWAWASRGLGAAPRVTLAIAAAVLGCLPWTLVRTGGIMGGGRSDLHWRWTPTPEEILLAQAADEPVPAAPAATPAAATPSDVPAPAAPGRAATPALVAPTPMKDADWPGFRGPDRNGVVRGVRIETDWSAAPPAQLWRRPVGPGWSSFSVRGDRFFTQEQRGDEEIVSSYRVSTGAPVWRHRDRTRFWESNGGAGPRGTPTLRDGRVYAFGATGILNSLDEATGAVIWSRNVSADAKVKVPMWGFASSPIVVDDLVIVAASGKLTAYDVTTGDLRWAASSVGGSYSSPQPVKIDGVTQIVMLGASGSAAFAPATGARLWESAWAGGVPIVQPAVIGERDVLVTTAAATGGEGVRRLSIAHASGKWTAEERWTSNGLKPYFNDYVVHKGYAFGFDGNILACVDLNDGARKWKGGRYGNGQLVLLPDQDLLLVITEEGDLALVKATAEGFSEVSRFADALEGKTWNHPVIVRDVLLLRNDHEMTAFRLHAASSQAAAR
jgi:outer membrane protein assembly factor BamB